MLRKKGPFMRRPGAIKRAAKIGGLVGAGAASHALYKAARNPQSFLRKAARPHIESLGPKLSSGMKRLKSTKIGAAIGSGLKRLTKYFE